MSVYRERGARRALVRSEVYRQDGGGQGSQGAKRAREQEAIPQKLGEKLSEEGVLTGSKREN